MLLSEFTDEYISKTVASASRSYCQSYPWFADDAKQIGFLALYELRQRLQIKFPSSNSLSSRNIYRVVKRAIGRALKAEIYPVDNNTPTETVIDYTDRLFLQDVWKRLSAEEKKVIRMYYFLEMTEQQIADKINLGQQRVSQIINQAIDKMGSE